MANAQHILCRYAVTCGVAVVISFLPSGLFAQTDESQPVVETPIAEQPTLVSTAEISNRADEVNTYLREVETGLDQNLTEIEAIPEQIESLEQQIEGLRPGVTPDVLARMSLRDLESAKNTWVGFEARLDRWRGPLEARSRSLDEQRNTRTVFCVWSTMIVVGNITLEDAR